MREIKFRFWDSIRKEWMVDGRAETNIYDFAFKAGMNWKHISKAEALERVVVMQYTERKDKNEVEVYAEDIVKVQHDFYSHIIGRVSFEDGQWMVTESDGQKWNLYSFILESIEVIGNMFDNPELLTATK